MIVTMIRSAPRVSLMTLALLLGGCPGTGTNVESSPQPSPLSGRKPPSTTAESRLLAPMVGGGRGDSEGVGTAAALNGPNGLAIGPDGQLYIAEAGANRIQRVMPDGTTSTVSGQGDALGSADHLKQPYGLLIRRDGSLVVADTGNHRIVELVAGGAIVTMAGDGIPGSANGIAKTAQFKNPFAVALTALDEIVVADTGNNLIRLIDRSARVFTIAGGDAGYADGEVGKAQFNGPADVAVNEVGHVIVADLRNHAIRVIDPVEGRVHTLAGAAEPGNQDGAAAVARFRHPSGLDIDKAGYIYVADTGNSAIRRIAPDGQTITLARLQGLAPSDVAIGTDGTIYVTDAASNQVLRSR